MSSDICRSYNKLKREIRFRQNLCHLDAFMLQKRDAQKTCHKLQTIFSHPGGATSLIVAGNGEK